MSNDTQSESWYNPESVRETVQSGLERNMALSRIARYLAEHTFEGIPSSRVETIIEEIPAVDRNSGTSLELSQSPSTETKPRPRLTKQLAVSDLEYLSDREAARLVGLALEQFDGNTVRPPGATNVESDLVWHRQHMTVALRLVTVPSGEVGVSHIDALLEGTVVSSETRSPSQLAIVTNRTYTEEALEHAAEHDILCFDAGHVEEWFRRARIPMDAVGTVLEDGEIHDGPLADLVEIPQIPAPRKVTDPLEIKRAFAIEALATDPNTDTTVTERTETPQQPDGKLDRTTARDDPLGGTQSTAGKTGTLYADPDEDGDYDAFDDYLDEI